jgi:putative addiction module component (TIGR02574 family)
LPKAAAEDSFKTMKTEFAPLFKLGRAERLQLVEDLWDSIAQEEAELPVPDWKHEELRRRKERFLQHPVSGRTWEQVKQRARTTHD